MAEEFKQKLKDGQPCNDKGYFDSYKCNVYGGIMPTKFQKMFDDADGSELHSKAEAIHSSSMLAYNFFHWIDSSSFMFDDVEYTQVFFEIQMKTLINSNRPANMDVVLIDKECKNILFIESKFTEFFDPKPWKLSDKYTKGNAYNKDVDWDYIITEIKKKLKEYRYKEGIKQLTTHLFGIANLCKKKALDWFNTNNSLRLDEPFSKYSVKFINLIFEPQKESFNNEHNSYEKYKELFGEAQKVIDDRIKIGDNSLNIIWKSYTDLWEVMKNQINKDLRDFLWQRYMRFAEGATE